MDIKIAIAARTSVYLPLYLAHERGYYGRTPDGFIFKIKPPERHILDTDQWVHDQVSDAHPDCLFGVCDPCKSYTDTDNDTKVIAALVTKAAFWAINTKTPVNHLSDARKFRRIIAYPKGMTGFLLYELTKDAGQEKESDWEPEYVCCEIGCELDKLKEHPADTLLITPDLFGALEICTPPSDYKIKFAYARHPTIGDYFLTGLITRNDVIRNERGELSGKGRELVKALVCALQLAVLEIRKTPEKAIEPLLLWLEKESNDTNRDIAAKVIYRLKDDWIFPEQLSTSRSMWADTIYYQRKQNNIIPYVLNDEVLDKSFENDVTNTFAKLAFDSIVLNAVEFFDDSEDSKRILKAKLLESQEKETLLLRNLEQERQDRVSAQAQAEDAKMALEARSRSWADWRSLIGDAIFPVLVAIYITLVLVLEWNFSNVLLLVVYIIAMPFITCLFRDKHAFIIKHPNKWIKAFFGIFSYIIGACTFFRFFYTPTFNSCIFIGLPMSSYWPLLFPTFGIFLFILMILISARCQTWYESVTHETST